MSTDHFEIILGEEWHAGRARIYGERPSLPCPHACDLRAKEHPPTSNWPHGRTEWFYTMPRMLHVDNGDDRSNVCLDCVLEAAAKLNEAKAA